MKPILAFIAIILPSLSLDAQARALGSPLHFEDYDPSYVDEVTPEETPVKAPEKKMATPSKPSLLFFNMNLNPREASALQKVARQQGLTFVQFPSVDLMKKVAPLYNEALYLAERGNNLEKKIVALAKTAKPTDLAMAKKIADLKTTLATMTTHEEQLEVEALMVSVRYFTPTAKEEELKKLEQSDLVQLGENLYEKAFNEFLEESTKANLFVKTFVISGHHGVEYYGDLTFQMKSKTWPTIQKLLSQTTTIALWGCDTINEAEAKLWLAAVPQFKLFIGYSDSAPLGSREVSSDFLQHGLLAYSNLTSVHSEHELQRLILKIPGAADTASAAVVRTSSGDFIFESKILEENASVTLIRKASALGNQLRCGVFMTQIKDLMTQVRPFFEGTQPIPADTTLSPIKRAYFELHHNRDCYTADFKQVYDNFQVGLMRFFESDVKLNLARSPSLIEKAALAKAELGEKQDATATVLRGTYDLKWIETGKRPETMAKLKELSAFDLALLPQNKAFVAALQKLIGDLNPACLPFDTWHRKSATPLKVSCVL